MSHDDDAEVRRFQAFLDTTDQQARDHVAFAEFADMIRNAAQCAVMSNGSDGGGQATRDSEAMHRAMTELLFGLLPRIPLGAVLENAEGIGYAIRYGILEPRTGALDHIQTPEELQKLAEDGHAADQSEIERRMDDLESK